MFTDADRLVGELGWVTLRIGGGEHPGEVQVGMRGGSQTFIAYGTEPMDRGTEVIVIGRRLGRALEVTPYRS